jgi:lipoprotein-releasing system ATP-binding protein
MLKPGSTSLTLHQISKHFGAPPRRVEVLHDITFELNSGQSLAIVGPSGSGKSTLLHLIGTLDHPSSGKIEIGGENPFSLPEPELARFRNAQIGFVFQNHHLLPQYSVVENVLIPTLAHQNGSIESEDRARTLLQRVGLAPRLDYIPAELSGGERQRVALARALINQPDILLCDEPTGNLDRTTAQTVADLLFELHREQRNILIIVTHSMELAGRCDRRFELREGKCCAV